jgi:hypothetical protein
MGWGKGGDTLGAVIPWWGRIFLFVACGGDGREFKEILCEIVNGITLDIIVLWRALSFMVYVLSTMWSGHRHGCGA